MLLRTFYTTCRRLAKREISRAKRLGRASNDLSLGVVGLANVGKSTFFQAITRSTLGNPANYPFATIDAEKSIVAVDSAKLNHYQRLFQSRKRVPTSLTVYDIAGLTRNASSGQGLGNKFLSDIRMVDGIFHMVRGFRDDNITHIEHSVDPVRDITIVTDELILKDLDYIETAKESARKKARKAHVDKAAVLFELDVYEKLSDELYCGRKAASVQWLDAKIDVVNQLNLLTAKPTVYLLNVSAADYARGDNEFLASVRDWIADNCPDDRLMLFSAEYENKLNELTCQELQDFRAMHDNKESALPLIVDTIRDVLHLISFYTCGPKEAHQWTVQHGSFAPEAAGAIHTDFKKGFISAQVYKWDDMKNETAPLDEASLKSRGKQLRVGKSYVVEDGDVMVIKSSR